MIGESFWAPKKPMRIVLLASVLAMVVLHQSELLGLMDSTILVFGWIPAQMAYDIAYLLVGVVILAVMYVVAPEPPAEYEPTVNADEKSATGTSATRGEE